jgi:hypothetical protein
MNRWIMAAAILVGLALVVADHLSVESRPAVEVGG